jgi:hypothetical protein
MKLCYRILLIISLLVSLAILIIGMLKSINEMIISGIICSFLSVIMLTGSNIKATVSTESVKIASIDNPLSSQV